MLSHSGAVSFLRAATRSLCQTALAHVFSLCLANRPVSHALVTDCSQIALVATQCAFLELELPPHSSSSLRSTRGCHILCLPTSSFTDISSAHEDPTPARVPFPLRPAKRHGHQDPQGCQQQGFVAENCATQLRSAFNRCTYCRRLSISMARPADQPRWTFQGQEISYRVCLPIRALITVRIPIATCANSTVTLPGFP